MNHVFITRPAFACFFTSKEWSAVAMCDAAMRCEKGPFWNGGCCGWNQVNPGKLNKNQPGQRMVGWYVCVFVLCFFSAPKNTPVYSLLLFVCIPLDWRFKTKKKNGFCVGVATLPWNSLNEGVRLHSSFESIMRHLPQVARFGGKWRPWRKVSSGIIWRPSSGMKSSLRWLKHHEKQNTNSIAERIHLIHADWLILTLIFKQQSHWARARIWYLKAFYFQNLLQ